MHDCHDTYYAALQHGHVDPDADDLVVGVVRRPMYGIRSYLDENRPELAPTDALLDEFDAVQDERDLSHDAAWDATHFGERYREGLDRPDAQAAMDDLLDELQRRDVWLVCYENTDEKRCHRTILREELLARA